MLKVSNRNIALNDICAVEFFRYFRYLNVNSETNYSKSLKNKTVYFYLRNYTSL